MEITNRFRASQPPTKKSSGTAAFCAFLVANEILTAWQSEKLLNGKFRGFFLNDFVLLDRLPNDANFGYYLARDVRDSKLVRLAVTPVNRTKGIEYRVDPYSE